MNLPATFTEKLSGPPLKRRWTDRFALDIALHMEGSGDDAATILEEHKVTPDELVEFGQDPLFAQRVEVFRTQLREKGLTFKLKAQAQAELLLDTSWRLIHDVDTSPAVKADLIKWTGKMAGLEPTKETGGADGAVTINIHMGDPSQAPPPGIRTIEHE